MERLPDEIIRSLETRIKQHRTCKSVPELLADFKRARATRKEIKDDQEQRVEYWRKYHRSKINKVKKVVGPVKWHWITAVEFDKIVKEHSR